MSDQSYDIVIRGGTVIDGTGKAPFVADVAIVDGRIAKLGEISGKGREEIDATGKIVTPGFIDVHTHYDGQAIWESRLQPSSGHGVTTVVIGNCGVGFAPCRAGDRNRLIQLMEGVEDIPGVVMTEGLTWDWETYPQFLDALDSRPHDINIASYLPHAPLRVYVMGERAAAGQPATAEDRARMAELTSEAIKAGAIGFATSRSLFHKSSNGENIPTLGTEADELKAIGSAMRDAGNGILQIATDYKEFTDIDSEFAVLRDVAEETRQLVSLPMAQMHSRPNNWREILDHIEAANADGLTMNAQVLPRGIGMLFGLDLSMHPFSLIPAYREIHSLPLAERIERMRDPDVRARILAGEPEDPTLPLMRYVRTFDGMFEMSDDLGYEPPLEQTIASRAKTAGIAPEELAYDILLKRGDQAAFYLPFANYADGNLEVTRTMFLHDDVVLGLGDGGAHYGVICDASFPTFLLTHWVRDRTRGPKLDLVPVVKGLTSNVAKMLRLDDRGQVAAGYNADINVIDLDVMKLYAPEIKFDLPAGGRRLVQRADGYVATIVNGAITYRNGQATGALTGRLARGAQSTPDRAVEREAAHV